MIKLSRTNGKYSEIDVSDYMTRYVIEELKRVEGVGKVQNFGAEKAMRIWVDPDRLVSYGLSIQDVNTAIQNQNLPISPGRIGDVPALKGQQITIPLTAQGQLETVEQFKNISLRAQQNGAIVRLSDVARVEIGAQMYNFAILENGKASTAVAIQMSPGANAVKTAEGVKAKIEQLGSALPDGMKFSIPYDTAPFVKISIEKVIMTLLEAMALVFIVMFIFLHNVRYTLIPAIVAPIALLGTFSVILLAHHLLQNHSHLFLVYHVACGCHIRLRVFIIDRGIDALDGTRQHFEHGIFVLKIGYHVCGVYS
jgi:multidrug efflux pump